MDISAMITTYNTAETDAASEILGKERHKKKPWVIRDVLDLCDECYQAMALEAIPDNDCRHTDVSRDNNVRLV